MKHTLLIGTDFRHSSLKMRDTLYLDDSIKPFVLGKIKGLGNIDECLILTTCNRIELYLVTTCIEKTSENIIGVLSRYHGIPVDLLKRQMYIKKCEDVAKHLFRVACGLESMVVGETQILGQVKKDYELSKTFGSTGPFLNKLFQNAISLGKAARLKTPIGNGITSIGSLAANTALKFADPKRAVFGIVGCGQMGCIAARHLSKHGVKKLYVTNRTGKKAHSLAKGLSADVTPFSQLTELLKKADVLITAVNSDSYLFTLEKHGDILKGRGQITIIDISTPRVVHPELHSLKNVSFFSLDDLKKIVDKNLMLRASSEKAIEELIERKLGLFRKWYEYKTCDIMLNGCHCQTRNDNNCYEKN